MGWELWPWRGAALAFAVALGWALAALRLRPRLVVMAAGLGVLAGWWLTFGLLTATPRQLPERLPLLALGLVLLAGFGSGVPVRGRGVGLALTALGAAAAGWWMAGAPMTGADLRRAAPVLAGVAAAALLLALRGTGRWRSAVAAGALLAGLVGAAAPGPWLVLGAALLAACLGAAAIGPGPATPVGALPAAGAVAALAALPVLARGTGADWAAALVPVAALGLGPVLARALPWRMHEALAATLAAGPLVAVSFFLR
jgi:hypothetical protein